MKIRKNKYNNTVTPDGYHSKREKRRAIELELLVKAGKIQDLKHQVSYTLLRSFKFNGKKIREIKYIADFVYQKGKMTIIEDCKGYKTETYKLKKKLLLHMLDANKHDFIET
tara:strand:- start:906 stop:1241 length:336 start_codon:yes stop_codon:yes gene_type:complete